MFFCAERRSRERKAFREEIDDERLGDLDLHFLDCFVFTDFRDRRPSRCVIETEWPFFMFNNFLTISSDIYVETISAVFLKYHRANIITLLTSMSIDRHFLSQSISKYQRSAQN